MALDSAGTLPSGPASSDMHAVSHPGPVHGARPDVNGETCHPFLPFRSYIASCTTAPNRCFVYTKLL